MRCLIRFKPTRRRGATKEIRDASKALVTKSVPYGALNSSRAGADRRGRNILELELLVAGVNYPRAAVVEFQHETSPTVGVDAFRSRLH